MPWIFQIAISSLLSIVLTLVATYLVHRYRQRILVAVEIVTNTTAAVPTVAFVVTNLGRSVVVVTELAGYVRAEEILTDFPPPKGPSFKKQHLLKLRRKFRTPHGHTDLMAFVAERALSKGAGKFNVMEPTETIRLEPNEKAARTLHGKESGPYSIHMDAPNLLTLVPSCKIGKQRHVIWGPPVVIGGFGEGETFLPIAISPKWD